MIPFSKPGASPSYVEMGAEATRRALADAGLNYSAIEQAYAGYVYGDSTCGQRALYQVGLTGVPIVNVNNNCSTGSTALYLARQAVASGAADCVLALGFEQMKPGALSSVYTDRPSAFEEFDAEADKLIDAPGIPLALRYFGGAGLAHMKKYGTSARHFPQGGHTRRRYERHADLAQRHDAPDGLPADLRRRGGGARLRHVRQAQRPRFQRRHQGASDDNRHALNVPGAPHDAARRIRHGESCGE
jgi:acetyl-CoA acetyltransferase